MIDQKITVLVQVLKNSKIAWSIYTLPEHIVNWNFANEDWCCPSAKNNLNVGGKYVARMEAKNGSFGFDFEAKYDVVVPFQKFIYTMPDGRVVEVQFEEMGSETQVKVIFDPESINSLELQKEGWQAILNNYKKYADSFGR